MPNRTMRRKEMEAYIHGAMQLGVNFFDHADIYEKGQENDKARQHYQYSADHGGQTALHKSASEKWHNL